jgi:WD40 repeat protein
MALARQVEDTAQGRAFPVIPVLLPGGDPRIGFLTSNSWVDLRSDRLDGEELDALARAVRGEAPEDGEAGIPEICPFRGLEPFREEDAAFFFGRDVFVESLATKVEGAKLLAVVGSSGSGKSSAVLAGLVPRLRQRRPPQPTWEVLDFTPGSNPFSRLARQVVGWLDPELSLTKQVSEAQELGGRLSRGEQRLGLYLEEGLKVWGADRLLLVVDQFEEILTQTKPEERKPFVEALLAAVSEAPVHLVVTLRGDFYGAVCDLDERLSQLVEEGVCNLGLPRREDLREAIERPAKLAGLRFEPPLLIEKLLDDVGQEPGNLPLLQYALLELWNGRSGDQLLADEKVDFSKAIAARADQIYGGLSEAQRGEARKIFVRLVQTSTSTHRLENTRRRARVAELGPTASEVIQAFSAKNVRLLVSDRDEQGRETVEVAHERLISSWESLKRWLADDVEFRLWRQRLEPSLEYFRRDRANVLAGSLLAEAERWLAERREELLPGERELIERSLEVRRRWVLERARRTRLAWIAAAAGLILALSAGLGFWRARLREQEARRASATTSFSSAVTAVGAENTDEALALLAQAVRIDPGWDVPRAFALNVLQSSMVVTELRHEKAVLSASFSPDGRCVVTVSVDGTARMWDASTGSPLGPPLRHEKSVSSASFSPDGRRVVTVSVDGTVRMWDVSTGSPLGPPLRHEHALRSASFSSDGRRMVTVSWDGTVRMWDVSTGSPLGPPLRHAKVWSAWFSPNGSQILTVSYDGTARLWDASTGSGLGPPFGHKEDIIVASFNPDGSRVVTASSDSTARLWDTSTGSALGLPLRHEQAVWSASFSPDGRRVVTASLDGTARLWDASTGSALGLPLRHEQAVWSASFSPDGRRVVTASSDGTARLWDSSTGSALGSPLRHEQEVISASFSPDGRRVMTLSKNGTVRLWGSSTGSRLGVPLRHEQDVWSASFSPDGRRVVTASLDGTARLWDASTGSALGSPLRHEQEVRSASFSPDGRRVVTASSDGTARLWDASTGSRLGVPLRHEQDVWSASFSPDGRRVVTASSDGTARLWDVSTGSALGSPLRHERDVLSALFSPDGRRVVTASLDGTARLWDASTGSGLSAPLRHKDVVWSASFSPDGRRVVTASADNTACLWDASTGSARCHPLLHQQVVWRASFSPDGRRLVTASEDGTARLWDTSTGSGLGAPLRHEQAMRAASFSPDSLYVVTASKDGMVRLWDTSTGSLLGPSLRHQRSVLSASFSPDGLLVVTASRDGTARLWSLISTGEADASLIADLAETVGGLTLTSTGFALTPNRERRLADLRRRAEKAPLGQSTALSLAHWLFMDPWERPIQPLSKMTVPHYICDALRHKAWQEAYEHFPGHPLLHNGPDGAVPQECAKVK